MVDFHSHILPGMDDGAKNVEESLALLKMSAEAQVTDIAATPHFYPWQTEPEAFLRCRQSAWEKLRPELKTGMPTVHLGAEVRYYQGIGTMEGLEQFTIGNSRLLLLEMPSGKWSKHVLQEVVGLCHRADITVLLAHFERYLGANSLSDVGSLVREGALVQSNADYFVQFSTRRRALRQADSGLIHFLGSDCHNLDRRPTKMGEATERIQKAFGERYLRDMTALALSYLAGEGSYIQ